MARPNSLSFPGKEGRRPYGWLKSERDALFDILQEHLAEVGGRWSSIDWQEVAKWFNQRFQGVTQTAGEMTAECRYETEKKQQLIAKDRLGKRYLRHG